MQESLSSMRMADILFAFCLFFADLFRCRPLGSLLLPPGAQLKRTKAGLEIWRRSLSFPVKLDLEIGFWLEIANQRR
jgi:hypothetical protein